MNIQKFVLWIMLFVTKTLFFWGFFHTLYKFVRWNPMKVTTKKERIEWTSRIVSSFYAGTSGILALYILYHEYDILAQNKYSSLLHLNVSFIIGYLINDTIKLLKHSGMTPDFLFHHILGIVFTPYIIINNYHVLMICYHIIFEVSTPFLNLCWYMIKLDQKNTKQFKFAMYTFVTLFFVCRILLNIPMFWSLYSNWHEVMKLPLFARYYLCVYILPLGLNIYWFKKIINQALNLSRKKVE